jgi:DNA-binding MarR family transcriptional regulator
MYLGQERLSSGGIRVPGDDLGLRPDLSDDVLETSRLLAEVLQAERAGRRAASSPGQAGASPGPAGAPSTVTPHLIRAAIVLHRAGSLTISQLAEGLGVSQGWASRLCDDLERAGYLERERDASDRRVVRVRLSPMAVERVELAYRWRGDAVEAAFAGMSEADRGVVREFLRRFVDVIRVHG